MFYEKHVVGSLHADVRSVHEFSSKWICNWQAGS